MTNGEQLGPYRIDELLGRGGMAEVYRAWNDGLHRFEALKLLPPQLAFDSTLVERFLREARMAAGLQHPNIATIYSVSSSDAPQPYFTMELVSGGSLSDRLRARGRPELGEAIAMLKQAASALDYAHAQGIIHRDIKPANILLTEGGQVKVVDFGIARAHHSGGKDLTRTGMIVGTPEYMSPEQAGNGQTVGPAADQYALAIVAYEMLCERTPFRAEGDTPSTMSVLIAHLQTPPRPPIEWIPNLTTSANLAILKALAKLPGDRFASCSAFVEGMTTMTEADFVPASASVPPAVVFPAAVPPHRGAGGSGETVTLLPPSTSPQAFSAPPLPPTTGRKINPLVWGGAAALAGGVLLLGLPLLHRTASQTDETVPPPTASTPSPVVPVAPAETGAAVVLPPSSTSPLPVASAPPQVVLASPAPGSPAPVSPTVTPIPPKAVPDAAAAATVAAKKKAAAEAEKAAIAKAAAQRAEEEARAKATRVRTLALSGNKGNPHPTPRPGKAGVRYCPICGEKLAPGENHCSKTGQRI